MKKKIIEVLDQCKEDNGSVKVQKFLDFPCPWVVYGTKEYEAYLENYGEPNHREIMTNEIVIDVDSDTKAAGRKHSKLVKTKLDEKKISYKYYDSGGSGFHFHMIYPDMHKLVKTKQLLTSLKYTLIKELLGPELLKPEGIKSHICMHNKTLIQIEFQKHRKGGTKKLLRDYSEIPNIFPIDVKDKVMSMFKTRKEIAEARKNIRFEGTLNCIKFLEGETVNEVTFREIADGYNRAIFFLISYYKNYKSDAHLLEMVKEFKAKHNVTRFNASMSGMIKTNNGSAGCHARQMYFDELECGHVCKGCPFTERKE